MLGETSDLAPRCRVTGSHATVCGPRASIAGHRPTVEHEGCGAFAATRDGGSTAKRGGCEPAAGPPSINQSVSINQSWPPHHARPGTHAERLVAVDAESVVESEVLAAIDELAPDTGPEPGDTRPPLPCQPRNCRVAGAWPRLPSVPAGVGPMRCRVLTAVGLMSSADSRAIT